MSQGVTHGHGQAEDIPALTSAGRPLLATKRFVPRRRADQVARPRLIDRLNVGNGRPLTLVAAPAGSGKTTLLADWLAAADWRPVAWVSLDPDDNDPALFWTYVLTALHESPSGVGGNALALLSTAQSPPIASILSTLINELSTLEDEVVLVLDDYHHIQNRSNHEALQFLLDNLPPQLRLVLATREDPPLPLARLRARNQLTEIRAADLRFTDDETAAFLNDARGLSLTRPEVLTLAARTEGWVAGLQLAALSLRGRGDIGGFIQSFAGDDRYIVDFLVEEVLQAHSPEVRDFLVRTAILDRMCGSLCDALTARSDGAATLESLERGNVFIVPLDDTRSWYRYHHLFADVLRARLLAEQPDRVADLHRRAGEWYERAGSTTDAIHHALAGGDAARAADLIEIVSPAMRRGRQEATWLRWLRTLPGDVFRNRPVLNVGYAAALLSTGDLTGVEERLNDAERWLAPPTADGAPLDEMVVLDHEEFRRLPGVISVLRAGRALALGDLDVAVAYAREALDRADADDHTWRGAALSILGLASWANGHLAAAYQSYAAGMDNLGRAGNTADTIAGAVTLADLRIAQGRLRDAQRIYENGLRLATESGAPVLRGAADMHVGLSALHREWGDLSAADQHLQASRDLGDHLGFPQNPCRWCVAMARIQVARNDLDAALELIHQAEREYAADYSPNVRPIAAMAARVWIAQGRLDDAFAWAADRGLTWEDEVTYLREYEHVTLARALLARAERQRDASARVQAQTLLGRLVQSAQTGERAGSEIEILLLLALAHQQRGDVSAALAPLERALALAEPESYVRTFVDEGPPMADLLDAATRRGIVSAYTRRLRAAFDPVDGSPRANQVLIEPLSDRELDVLRLLATDLSGPEIATELVVSLNTVRTHTRNIYAKLGVNGRRAAIRQAEERGLLSRPR